MKNLLITGGAGFIGSHVIRRFVNKFPDHQIFNLDALTYAGNLENLQDIEAKENYTFLHGDITDETYVNSIFKKYKFKNVIHLAAESHVDRSIADPLAFAKAIFENNKVNCKISPIKTQQYPTAATRPNFSLLCKKKIKNKFEIVIPHWRESLKECLTKINVKSKI